MLNNTALTLRQKFHYEPSFDNIRSSLPKSFQQLADQEADAINKMLSRFIEAEHSLEVAHWDARMTAYHEAVEHGRFLVVDNNGTTEEQARDNNDEAKRSLNLGEFNKDYFECTSSSLSEKNERGNYAAILYLRRRDYPEPFELLDQIEETNRAAKTAVEDLLGLPMHQR